MNWIKNNQKLITLSFIIVIIAITVLSLLPPRSTVDLGNNDKLSHFLAYSVLTTNALLIKRFESFKIRLLLILIAYGGFMEFIQGYIPGRQTSFWDMGANTVGVLLGFLLIKSRLIS